MSAPTLKESVEIANLKEAISMLPEPRPCNIDCEGYQGEGQSIPDLCTCGAYTEYVMWKRARKVAGIN